MHIGIDARFYGPSHAGLGRYTKNLVDRIVEVDTKNTYTIFLHTSNFDQFNTTNPRVKKVEVPIAHYSVKEQVALPGLLNKHQVDVMHFPHLNVPLGYKGNFVVTIHDLIMHKFKNRAVTTRIRPLYEIKHLGYRAVTRWAATRAQTVIVPSQAVKDEIIEFYQLPPDKVVVTYEAADDITQASANKVAQADIDLVMQRYGISNPFIMYVGNVYPHKNIENLAKAMHQLHDQHGLHLVLPSARSIFLERTEDMMKQHGVRDYVTLPGYVPDEDLAILYQQARAYVFPSLAEGFGLPPLEAMAAGLPVVCSNIPVLKEICQDAALYFDPQSPSDIADKVGYVTSNDRVRQDLIKKGRAHVKKFSWKTMAEQTLGVYERSLS